MKSMTGYGKASVDYENKTISIEIRTLNSKQADVNVRIPNAYRSAEIEIQNAIKQKLERGKIDCFITVTYMKGGAVMNINEQLFKDYYAQLSSLTNSVPDADKSLLTYYLLNRDDINQPIDENFSQQEKQALFDCLNQVLDMVDAYRITEGEAMHKAFEQHISVIESCAKEVEPFEKNRVPMIKEKLLNRFKELNIEGVEENRLEQELIFYLEKLDITEERVRLNQHINYFRQTMLLSESIGKKLGFIAQEMGREINTLGSKSNDADMQKIVVRMKDELEKIKEQSANIL